MSWHHEALLGFDTESTGVDPLTAELVSFALCWFDGDTLAQSRYALVNAGVEIPESATKVHGITTDMVRERGGDHKRQVEGIIGELMTASKAGIATVAFNASYDLTLLNASAERLGVPSLVERGFEGPVLDGLVIDRHVDKWRRGSRRLDAVCTAYAVDLGSAHHALADAIAAVRVVRAMASKYPEIAHAELDVLHVLEKGWAREWLTSYNAYRVDKGEQPLSESEAEWPIRIMAKNDPGSA